MNRTLQPLVLILGVGFLVAVRLIASQDIFSGFVDDLLRRDASPVIEQDDSRIQTLNQRIDELERELEFKNTGSLELAGAHIVNKTSASFRQIVKIDRGTKDGVQSNMPVVAKGYLIGLVSEAGESSSTVLLMGDPDLNVPVIVGGADGIAAAKAGGLVVTELDDGGRAQSGQAVSTSGLGGLYPPGLPLGELGARLSGGILGEFVLNRPFSLSELSVVQVVLP